MFARNVQGHIWHVDETYVYLDKVNMAQILSQCQEEVYLGLQQIAVEHQTIGAVADQYPANLELFQ
jgi:hypothetical protein